jgi:hypothetical protein
MEKSMEILWSLGHRKTKVVEKNLYTNQLVQRVVESLANGDTVNDWMVWCPGWAKWGNLTEVAELMEEISILERLSNQIETRAEPPSFPQTSSSSEEKHQYHAPQAPTNSNSQANLNRNSEKTVNRDNIQASADSKPESNKINNNPADVNWEEKRQFKRVHARFRCIIRSSSLTFRTFTKDISLGGVALEDTIPSELLGNECTIFITSSNNKKNLKFKIKVTPRPGAKFFSFENTNQEFINELNIWLEQFPSAQTNEKKKAS